MKKFLLIIFMIMISAPCAFAEKLVVKITPTQTISTHYDEVRTADWLDFKVVSDVLSNGNVYIKRGTKVYAVVSSVKENKSFARHSEIKISKFRLKDVNGNSLIVSYPLTLNRKSYLTPKFKDKVIKHVGGAFRGNEILIKPESIQYKIILNK